MFFKLMTLVHLCAAFPLKCPEPTQWRLRANSHCADPSKYSCVQNDIINGYSENCTWSDFQQAGRISVLRGGIDADICSAERYQPPEYIFYTNASTNCILLKTFCKEEGQVIYDPGDRNTDATCRCDYRQGYDFLINPNNPCFCKPSIEDCSCMLKICSNRSHILSPDYKCIFKSDLPPVTHCRSITGENDNSKRKPDATETVPFLHAIVPWKKRSAMAIFSIFCGTVTLVLCILLVCKRQFWKYCLRTFENNGPEPELNLIEGDTLTLQYMFPLKRPRLCVFKDDMLIALNVRRNVFRKTNVTLGDEGNYFAKVCNIRSRITKVTVQSMFTSEINQINCIEGGNLQMKCSVYSEHICVEWFKDNNKINENTNISIESYGKDHFMTVQHAKLSDEGQYMIVAGNVRKQITVTVKVLPEAINRLQDKDKARYIKLLQSSELEKRYFVRIMIVGKESVGKSSLVKRLLKEEKIDDVISTDGIDITVHRCKINIDDGKWMIGKFTCDDRGDRMHRVVQDKSIKKHIPINESHEQSNTSSVMGSADDQHIDISDTTTFSDLKTSTPMLEQKIEHLTDEEDICLGSVTIATYDIKNINNNTKDISIENEDTKKSLNLVMPPDLMSRVFSLTSTSNIPSNHYALCGLWDFAGQREFYATHQAFLTSSAIYLVVADMADDICKEEKQQCFADFQNVGEYVDFWFDSIHCHQTIEPRVDASCNDHIDPPVILVLTGTDKYKEKDKERRKTDLQNQLDVVLRNQGKYHHLRRIFCLSNKTDPYNEFEKLQEEISTTVRGMKSWGEEMPLKWILLEHLIEINKNNGKNFINLSEMAYLAKHSSINIIDMEEVKLFLCFQHEVGSIIYFEDIHDFIILKPKWLVDAFKCLVSDKIDDKLQHRSDSTKFVQNGQISESLIFERFKSKCYSQFSGQMANLLKVMEKFDILVKIDETSSYIMPSMMQYISFDKICEQIGVEQSNCRRTSWLCLKFAFLPPAFFNHVSVWFIRKYKPSKIGNTLQSLALFRGICVFDIEKSGCEKLLVTMSTDTIAIQLLSFSTKKKDFSIICGNLYEDLIGKIHAIKKRYKLTISYKPRFKCSTGHYFENTITYKELKRSPEYYCQQHKEVHQSHKTYLPWMINADVIWLEYKDLLNIDLHFLTSEFTLWLADYTKVIPNDLQEARLTLDKIKVMEENVTRMAQELANSANRCENLDVSIENNISETEDQQESSVSQLSKKVDGKFIEANSKIEKIRDVIHATIQEWERGDRKRGNVGDILHSKDELYEIQENPAKTHFEAIETVKDMIQEVVEGKVDGPDESHTIFETETLHEIKEGLKNRKEMLKQLLDNEADINQCRDKETSPLHVACFLNNIEIVKILLENTENINKYDGNGATALYIACQNNHKEIVKLLLDNKADLNKCANNGASPLNIACQNDHVELVKVLLENKADVDTCNGNGATPLYMACQNNHTDIVKLLLDNKADINACDDLGGPLYIACQNNHIELVKILLDNKADINKCSRKGASPLNVACQNDHVDLVKVLLENKADINKCVGNGATALYMACQNNHKEIVKLLLDNKADINIYANNGASPLNVACMSNHIEVVNMLLENKADIDKCDGWGATALYMACQNNHKELVKLLLDNKADINKCALNGASPLDVTCVSNHIELVKILLENKADINMIDGNGVTALYMACQNNHKEVVKLLLYNKADINKCALNRGSPLNVACVNNHIELVKVLLENKAEVDKCDGFGATALYMACQNNHIEIVKLLLDNKADVNKCALNGASPLEVACVNSHEEVVKLLLQNKAVIR